MKTIIATLVLGLISLSLSAQKIEPKIEKNGSTMKATFYHDNGQIAQVGYFEDGRFEGDWVMYDQNGKKMAIGTFHEGKRTGEWFFWKRDGQALREVTYLDGRLVSVVEWGSPNSTL